MLYVHTLYVCTQQTYVRTHTHTFIVSLTLEKFVFFVVDNEKHDQTSSQQTYHIPSFSIVEALKALVFTHRVSDQWRKKFEK